MAANVKLGFFGRMRKAFVLGSREYRRLASICDGEIVAMGRLRRDLEAREAELVHLRGLLDEADKLLAGDAGEVVAVQQAGEGSREDAKARSMAVDPVLLKMAREMQPVPAGQVDEARALSTARAYAQIIEMGRKERAARGDKDDLGRAYGYAYC